MPKYDKMKDYRQKKKKDTNPFNLFSPINPDSIAGQGKANWDKAVRKLKDKKKGIIRKDIPKRK